MIGCNATDSGKKKKKKTIGSFEAMCVRKNRNRRPTACCLDGQKKKNDWKKYDRHKRPCVFPACYVQQKFPWYSVPDIIFKNELSAYYTYIETIELLEW